MSTNPFEPPATGVRPAPDPLYRQQALVAFRRGLLILAIPAVLNFAAFDLVVIGLSDLPAPVAAWYRTVNTVAFVGGAIALWYLGLPLLEVVSQSIRLVAAKAADAEEWLVPLYFMVRSIVGPSVVGGLLWLAWTVAIYEFRANFTLASWAAGLPATLLVGVLIVPMLIRWRELASAEPVGAL